MNNRSPKTIAFVHHKGGGGKTTACINIAGYLQKLGKKVLVVDLDPQGNATAGLGLDRRRINSSLHDVLFGNTPLSEIIQESRSGVHVAPSSSDLLAAEIHAAELEDPTGILFQHLENVKSYYDYILLDVPPASTILMINGIACADALIVPLDAGIFGVETLETLKILLEKIEEELGVNPTIFMILLRAYPHFLFGKDPTKELLKMVEGFLNTHQLFDTKIHQLPYSKDVFASQMKGIPLSHYKPHSSVGKVFEGIAKDIIHYETTSQNMSYEDQL